MKLVHVICCASLINLCALFSGESRIEEVEKLLFSSPLSFYFSPFSFRSFFYPFSFPYSPIFRYIRGVWGNAVSSFSCVGGRIPAEIEVGTF